MTQKTDFGKPKLLTNTDNQVLWQVSPGKPNPKQQATSNGEFRGRVVQSAYKGNTCWYYTLNFLRDRIGPSHDESLEGKRSVERRFSILRKTITDQQNQLPSLSDQIGHEKVRGWYRSITVSRAKNMIRNWDQTMLGTVDRLSQDKEENYVCHRVAVGAFARNPRGTSNFLDYMIELKSSRAHLFKNIVKDPEAIYNLKMKPFTQRSWKELEQRMQSAFTQSMAILEAANVYGLKLSTWTPGQGFDKLYESLQKHGPHAVAGALGAMQYNTRPRVLCKIGGRSIFSWKKGTQKKDLHEFGHMVLLVGAQKDYKLLYYIDSQDPSDPSNIEEQRIYAMSYNTFTDRLSCLMSLQTNDDRFSYAIHR